MFPSDCWIELDSEEEMANKRIKRILTSDLPMYFALVSRVTRVKQESTVIGTEGGVLSSNVVPQVQAVFPEGTLRRPIPVGLQVSQFYTQPLGVVLFSSNRSAIRWTTILYNKYNFYYSSSYILNNSIIGLPAIHGGSNSKAPSFYSWPNK